MCDTFVVFTKTDQGREVIFGKNSDRPRGEIQDVIQLPAQDYPADTTVQCTYLPIPQAGHTYAVILSKPRWMWGAEMGANEKGVVIGNEAVWTTQPCNDTGLLGMDLLRLGLERGATALEALENIVALLAEHGQGGNCAEHLTMTYHNSFLIADNKEAWALETADQYWVAERITSGSRSISNNLSIRNKGDRRHQEFDRAMQAENKTDFNFAQLFSMYGYEEIPSANSREGRVRELCQQNENQFTEETAKVILKDHEGDICMHGEFETRGSQVSLLSAKDCRHMFTEDPFPCTQEYQLKNF